MKRSLTAPIRHSPLGTLSRTREKGVSFQTGESPLSHLWEGVQGVREKKSAYKVKVFHQTFLRYPREMVHGDNDKHHCRFHESYRPDIQIRFFMGQAAHRQKRDDRSVVGQGIEAS